MKKQSKIVLSEISFNTLIELQHGRLFPQLQYLKNIYFVTLASVFQNQMM